MVDNDVNSNANAVNKPSPCIDDVVLKFANEGIKTDNLVLFLTMCAITPQPWIKKITGDYSRKTPDRFDAREYNLSSDERYAIWSVYRNWHNSRAATSGMVDKIEFDPPNWEKYSMYLLEFAIKQSAAEAVRVQKAKANSGNSIWGGIYKEKKD